jgi:hypothetical protein
VLRYLQPVVMLPCFPVKSDKTFADIPVQYCPNIVAIKTTNYVYFPRIST